MDQLAEFAPTVLDALRQAIEDRVVRISRQGAAVTFPTDGRRLEPLALRARPLSPPRRGGDSREIDARLYAGATFGLSVDIEPATQTQSRIRAFDNA